MKNYETLSEAVNDLTRRGYTVNFNIESDCLSCKENNINIHPDEFEIDEIHRFEGDTDPGDENILFAISSNKYKMKGLLVNAYGMYSDSTSSAIISKLHMSTKLL